MTEPEEFSPSFQPPGHVTVAADEEPGQLFELAGLKVTAKMQCRGQSKSHHSHLDSCTDLGKTTSAPSSQGQSFSSTFGGLAGGPHWLLSQRWVFHLQLDSEQIPTTRNREQREGRKACISSPLIPSLSVCHKSTLFLLEWEVQHALFPHFKLPLPHPPTFKIFNKCKQQAKPVDFDLTTSTTATLSILSPR